MSEKSPAFVAVDLPGFVVALDGETIGRSVLVRAPTPGEITRMEGDVEADDIVSGLATFYGLAAISVEAALRMPDQARAALDQAITARIQDARRDAAQIRRLFEIAATLGVHIDAESIEAYRVGSGPLAYAILEAAAALRPPVAETH